MNARIPWRNCVAETQLARASTQRTRIENHTCPFLPQNRESIMLKGGSFIPYRIEQIPASIIYGVLLNILSISPPGFVNWDFVSFLNLSNSDSLSSNR